MTKPIIKRSVVISGHATSVSLEPEFWNALQEIATKEGQSIAALIRLVDQTLIPSDHRNLSSALRVFILQWFRGRREDLMRQRYQGSDQI